MAYRATVWSRRLASIRSTNGWRSRPQAAIVGLQANEHWVRRRPGEGAVQLGLDPVELGEPVAGALVADVVDEPGVAVDGHQVCSLPAWQQPGRDDEVLAGGEVCRGGAGRFDRSVANLHRPPRAYFV